MNTSETYQSRTAATVQLRRYKLVAEHADEFVRWWRESLVPVRRKYGFSVDAAWLSSATNEFIWAVSVPGDVQEFD